MFPLFIVSLPGAILSVPRRGPFDGSDWSADPVETSHRTAKRCTATKRTTRRRREEIKGGSLGSRRVSKRGIQEIEESSGRTTGGQPRPLRDTSSILPDLPTDTRSRIGGIYLYLCAVHFCPSLSICAGCL